VLNEAAKEGGVAEIQTEWLDAYYRNAAGQILNLYERARLVAWRIYDSEEAAEYWQEQTESAEKLF